MLKRYLNTANASVLSVWVMVLLLLTWIQQEYVTIPHLTNLPVVDEAVKSRMADDFYRTRWLGFLVSPLLLVLRLSLTASSLFIGGIFKDGGGFRQWWDIALKSDVFMIVSSLTSCIVTLCFGAEQSAMISRYFSLAFIYTPNHVDPWIMIPLSAVNVFEISYWLFMAEMVSLRTGRGYRESLKFVMESYGVAYLFYIVFLMFLMLYIS